MFLRRFFESMSRKPAGARRSSAGKRRLGGGNRRYSLEPLEERSLLSVSVGLPPSVAVPQLYFSPPILRSPVAPATVATALTLFAPEKATVGVPIWVDVKAVDANGHRVPNYAGSVTLSSTLDPTIVVTPSNPITKFHYGDAQVQVTFDTANAAMDLMAADNSTPPLTAPTVTINVAAAPVATALALFAPEKATVGVPVWVDVKAVDANGHRVLKYVGSVTLSSTLDPTIVVTPSNPITKFQNGEAQVQVTFDTANAAMDLKAADNSTPPLTAPPITINVAAAPVATALVLLAPEKATVGVPIWVDVKAVDANGHRVSKYAGSVTLSSMLDPTIVVTPSNPITKFHNGEAQVQVTFDTANAAMDLKAADNSTPPLTAPPITINVAAAPVATALVLLAPEKATVGVPIWVDVKAVDANGHRVLKYAGSVTLSSTLDPTIVVTPSNPITKFHNGEAQVQVTFNTANAAMDLKAVDNLTPPLTAPPITINVVAAPVATALVLLAPERAIVGIPVWVDVKAVDANGHRVPNYAGSVTLSSTLDPTLVVKPSNPVTKFHNGEAWALVIFDTANAAMDLKATDNSTPPLIAPTVTIDVAAWSFANSLALETPTSATRLNLLAAVPNDVVR